MLTISAKALGRKKPLFADYSVSPPDALSAGQPVTLRDLIGHVVRAEVAAWVHEGLSDGRIEQLVVARFGEQVLLIPSGSGADLLLWVVPVAVIGGGGVLLAGYLWRRRRLEPSRAVGGVGASVPEDRR